LRIRYSRFALAAASLQGPIIERFSVGGVSSGVVPLAFGQSVGIFRTFPVRAIRPGSLYGRRAATVTAEYRVPLALVGPVDRTSPFGVDKFAVAVFGTSAMHGIPGAPRLHRLRSAGAELIADMTVSYDLLLRLRLGSRSRHRSHTRIRRLRRRTSDVVRKLPLAVSGIMKGHGCAPAPAALAQSPADRATLESLRDSLGLVTDSTALHRLEATTIQVAKERRDDPSSTCVSGSSATGWAKSPRSNRTTMTRPANSSGPPSCAPTGPYPWYGLGLAELAIGEPQLDRAENIRQMLGKDYLSKAAKAFARAAEADPAFASAVVDLANTALTQRIRPRLEVALTAVRLAAAGPAGRHPDVQLVRGRIEREAGESDSALSGFSAYSRGGRRLRRRVARVGAHDVLREAAGAGWAAYFAGAHAATSAQALTMYRLDLSWIADSSDLAAFDGLRDPERASGWLEQFWTRRDFVGGP